MTLHREPLPQSIMTRAQVRELDRLAIEQHGISGFELMRRAGQASFEYLRRRWPAATKLVVFCGAGNNGGDGYLLADIAHQAGFSVRVLSLVDSSDLRGDAARASAQAAARGIVAENFDALRQYQLEIGENAVIVDALLGSGLARPVEGLFASAIECINQMNAAIFALDIPSGLDADTGIALGAAVRADATMTFVGLKRGLFLGVAPDYRGDLAFGDLGIGSKLTQAIIPALTRLDETVVKRTLAPRSPLSHKGMNGRVLLVGGGPGMSGAIRLAAEASLRGGAGLVYVATHPQSAAIVSAGRPEIMCRGVSSLSEIDDWAGAANVMVLGPGLGLSDWGRRLYADCIQTPLPLVVDADGLNLLAEDPIVRANWVLTPHPGEAARLLTRSVAAVQAARADCVGELAVRYGAVSVLKGACSLIAQVSEINQVSISVCDYGNPGMAVAGMGDVLAGLTGSLLAQTGDAGAAARTAVLIHALAGDDAAGNGQRGMIASDLMPHIRRRVNPT